MPRSIKPHMSKDELISFDKDILGVTYDDGLAVIVLGYDVATVTFDKKDLEDLIQFIKRNEL